MSNPTTFRKQQQFARCQAAYDAMQHPDYYRKEEDEDDSEEESQEE